MLIPKFSIRQMMLAMIAIGVCSACIAGAVRGNIIAKGLSVAILGLIIPFVAYALVHWTSLIFARMSSPVVDYLFLQSADIPSEKIESRANKRSAISDVEPEVIIAEVVVAEVVQSKSEHSEQNDG